MELRKIIDNIIDNQAGKNGFNIFRSKSFYCSPNNSDSWNESDIKLELKVNPKKLNVFDADIATGVTMAWLRTDEGENWLENNENIITKEEKEKLLKLLKDQNYYPKNIQEYATDYWNTSLTLDQFLNIEKERKEFKSPEILVQDKIEKEYIRIVPDKI